MYQELDYPPQWLAETARKLTNFNRSNQKEVFSRSQLLIA
jgi:hypothetical protein